MYELLGLAVLAIAVAMVIRNPHRRDADVDQLIERQRDAIRENRRRGGFPSATDLAWFRIQKFD